MATAGEHIGAVPEAAGRTDPVAVVVHVLAAVGDGAAGRLGRWTIERGLDPAPDDPDPVGFERRVASEVAPMLTG